ncbi:flagellar protein FliS [Desulfuromusa kysingii]|uniref:Flagellar secretion chaperone FliS n=1 Tax=Desulfuromusa kysingii TaxID=37625 RepID=A0A1H3VMS5_9BACT|nr:flagellar export chaperone FliS [Desulfuromusa kysingii]SDZ76080.1 flagellar protein FliS [Desulfuromusa kysingii]
MNAYVNQYQNNQILSASPEQILIMLYDGAIRFCRQAQLAMEQENRKVQAEKISRAMAIVCEFSNTLNHEVGGDIAADLDGLYGFMSRELTRANLQNDRKALETVENLLTGLRETWVEAIEINRGGAQQVAKTEPEVRHVAAAF